MATIRRYGRDLQDYIVLFELSNGKKYFIGNGFVVLDLVNTTTLEQIEQFAKQYKLQGAKNINSKIWNRKVFQNIIDDDVNVVKTEYVSFEHVKRYSYVVNGKRLVNLLK